MALFTTVLDFRGGTFISQVRADSVRSALKKYSTQLLANEALGRATTRERLATELAGEEPVAIEGASNVWCCSVSVKNHLALLNIIETVD